MGYIDQIRGLGACENAIEWLEEKNYPTAQEAWDACGIPHWLLWLVRETAGPNSDKKPVVMIACECARLLLPFHKKVYPSDPRVRRCIEVTEEHIAGELPIDNVALGRLLLSDEPRSKATLAAQSAATSAMCWTAYHSAHVAERVVGFVLAGGAMQDRDLRSECAVIIRKYFPVVPPLERGAQ